MDLVGAGRWNPLGAGGQSEVRMCQPPGAEDLESTAHQPERSWVSDRRGGRTQKENSDKDRPVCVHWLC